MPLAASPPVAAAGGGGSSSGGGSSGGSGGEGCSSSGSSPLARTATAPPSISWGARGQGTWQKVVCPVCGPVCNASMHGLTDPPPQDVDEGGGDGEECLRRCDEPNEPNVGTRRELGAAVGGSRESVAGTGTDGAAAVIDLTLSDEDDEEQGGQERHARAKASFDEAKRPRLIPSTSVGASEGGRGGGAAPSGDASAALLQEMQAHVASARHAALCRREWQRQDVPQRQDMRPGLPWGPTDWSSHTTSYAAWHACHVELRALHPHQQEDCDTLCSMPAVEICAMTMSRRVV